MRNRRKTSTNTPGQSTDEVEQAIARVREAYEFALGLSVWIDEQDGGYGSRVYESAMEKFGLGNADDPRRYRLMVDSDRGFRPSDIDELCERSRTAGHPLRVSLLKKLTVVRTRKDRLRLAKAMLRDGWSNRQLESEIRLAKGGKGHQASNGRKPILPRTKQQMVDEFTQIAIRWQRYQSAVAATDFWNELDSDKRKAIEAVNNAMIRGGF